LQNEQNNLLIDKLRNQLARNEEQLKESERKLNKLQKVTRNLDPSLIVPPLSLTKPSPSHVLHIHPPSMHPCEVFPEE